MKTEKQIPDDLRDALLKNASWLFNAWVNAMQREQEQISAKAYRKSTERAADEAAELLRQAYWADRGGR